MYIVKWAASWLLNVYLADFSEILKAACMRWATQPCRKFSKVISIGFVHSTNCISGWFLGFFSQQHVCSRRHDSFWAHAGQCICQLAGAAAMGRYVCGSYMTYVYVWHGMYSYVCHECFCKLDSAIAVGRYVCSCHSTYVHEWHGMYSCVCHECICKLDSAIAEGFSWWVLRHCTGFARLVWGRLRVHRAFVYSDWFVCYVCFCSLLSRLTLPIAVGRYVCS